MPSISILCPAYRTEQWLGATIDSVLGQTSGDWQLVVVDNGMSQEVADIVGAYDDPRIVLVRQENDGLDGGFTAARAAATGRYLLPLCSDDLLVPSTCARFVEVMDASPEIDVLASDAHVHDEDRQLRLSQPWSRATGVPRGDLRHRIDLREVVGGRDLYYGAAFRAEVWDDAGGYVDGSASDLGLWLRVLAAGRDVRVLPERLGVFRVRAGSVSHDPRSDFHDQVEALLERAVETSADPSLGDALAARLRRRRETVALGSARAALLRGEVDLARSRAREAVTAQATPRSVAVLVGTTLAPRLLRRLHPVKQQVQQRLAAVRHRARGD